ncbi:hydrolase [Legionella sp. km772]|uniref:hydrolase n=1 Tax=Legionella sp. km772 TaxID=2498111 RepID=UPI000F8C4A93|nr:hydrolase [Legionella sp. km772]RUR11965.1 hydrolase [Legionella sp. km772]
MLLNRKDSLLLLIDVQEKLVPFISNKEQCIPRCEWLLKLAAKMQVPVFASEQYPKGLGSTISELYSYIPSTEFIEKVHFSCMQEPNFVHRLTEHKKNQLILLGIEAHVCVMQTALELKTAGFEVFVVVDAVGSRSPLDYKYGLKRMKNAGIHLITAEMVFFEWLRQSNIPDFKALSKEFLQ